MQRILRSKSTFFVVLAITLILGYLSFFGVNTSAGIYKVRIPGAADMRFGIDIRGGVDATFTPKGLGRKPTSEELEAARTIMEIRLDQNNILDRDVTIDTENGFVFVRFPWKSDETNFDPDSAIAELGTMAKLTFKDPDGGVVIEGMHVEHAESAVPSDGTPGYEVRLRLRPEGQALFAAATARLVGQQISINMDDNVISAPTVNEAINSADCVITGLETQEEARTLANLINSGALPFALETSNYSAISPLLGSNALDVTVIAGILAFVLICIGLIAFYRLSGVIASISLLLQVAGQLILLTWPQFTVTLPGIAGIILSIGMAVDANIIISERIREELRDGKRVEAAVASGFTRAFSSVFDGNITVLIVAIVMRVMTSGAMLSFAYTLLFGIIMNFVAGVSATRLLTSSIIRFKFAKNPHAFLSEKSLHKEVKIFPFYQKRKIFFAISGALMLVGLIFLFINGVSLDIQFKGGAILKYDLVASPTIDPDDAAAIAGGALGNGLATAQITTDYMSQNQMLVLNIAGGDGLSNEALQGVTDALIAAFPDQGLTLAQTNNVAPFFGQKFLTNGIIALLLSALLIIAYVWFSFRKIHGLSAGVTALLALLHDVIIVFFTFVVCRIPIGDSFIAVALTILGYSINDTIVIYDRIRENSLAAKKGVKVDEIVDRSISQSLTRSINTSLAVFLAVGLVYVFAAGNGLESIRTFALPMAVGTISGWFSSVVIAAPLWTMWQKRKEAKA
ncbi:MAG: protein translocase subunit SecD [Christensenellaceae bacterium]|jgi:SecD/SecF fusion protein|nr:protein translocase subunit SecD [Christensenellaceae bacterium]